MGYKEYIWHMENECYSFRPYKCMNECQQHEMNIHEFKFHLSHECQSMLFNCTRCDQSRHRHQIKEMHTLQ